MAVAVLNPLASSVRRVLSGVDDGQSEVVARIGRPAGAPGWFAPGDDIWTAHGSVATFLGGIRSLLLQSLHPLALAGVQQNSRYRDDPFGRLQRTGAFIAATTYGSTALAEQTVAGIRQMHAGVAGTAPDGRSYSAQNPRLLLWVHVALADSMLTAYQSYGHYGPVDADGYVRDMAVVGERIGVVAPPRDAASLAVALEGFRGELRRSADSDQMKRFILHAPLPPGLRPGYALLARAALDSLPPWAVRLLGERPATPAVKTARKLATDIALRTLAAALVKSPAQAAGERRLAANPAPARGSSVGRARS